MEVQSECAEPPQCDPQPTGKINKAAFKLFGKRRAGSGMASFFSFRNKGPANNGGGSSENGSSVNGNNSSAAAAAELVRSKTHDGLTGSNSDAEGQRGERPGGCSEAGGPVRSLGKSLSFFSLLRRGSFRATSDGGGAGLARRGRGLKGFFSSMRWRRREKTNESEADEAEEGKKRDGDGDADAEGGVKDVTLTLEPPPHRHPTGDGEAAPSPRAPEIPSTSVIVTPQHCTAMPGPSGEPDSPFPYTPTDSPLRPPVQKAKASVSSLTPPLDRCCSSITGDPPSEPSVERLCSLLFTDVTSLKSFDSLTGCGDIIADADEEAPPAGNGGSGTSSSSSGGGGGGSAAAGASGGRAAGMTSAAAAAASRGSPCKPSLPPQLTQFASNAASAALPARGRGAPPPPPPQQQHHPAGSGVVAYMGGGEEMASPEGVDDADMQGLWHMLPSAGDNSPALPRSHQASCSAPTSTYPPRANPHPPAAPRSMDRKKVPQVKALGLSKIPVVGGAAASRAAKPPPPLPNAHGRHPTSPLSDEGYWDTPSATPTATPDESGLRRERKVALSRDSCSGDHLYDLYNEEEEEEEEEGEEDQQGDEELHSTPSPSTEHRMSPTSQTSPPSSSSSSSFRSMKGSASLPRESKIPVSTAKTPPPHSVSQSALSSVLEAESPPPKTQAAPPARTRIPVSKVPVRRSVNKAGSTTGGSAHKK